MTAFTDQYSLPNILLFYRRVKAWTEAHFFYEALVRFIQNVLLSTILHANRTTKKCIQFFDHCIKKSITWKI
jgi:hypothetical protein